MDTSYLARAFPRVEMEGFYLECACESLRLMNVYLSIDQAQENEGENTACLRYPIIVVK